MSFTADTRRPKVIIVAGPNGSGKSTTAPVLLSGAAPMKNYINPDIIARGLAPRDPGSVAFAAGRIVHDRIRELTNARESFSFETTLAGKTYVKLVAELSRNGYETHIIFLWLNTVELAVERVAERIRYGGHSIPEDDIRRRYDVGIRNLLTVYRPIVTSWRIYDNSNPSVLRRIALERKGQLVIDDNQLWQLLYNRYGSYE